VAVECCHRPLDILEVVEDMRGDPQMTAPARDVQALAGEPLDQIGGRPGRQRGRHPGAAAAGGKGARRRAGRAGGGPMVEMLVVFDPGGVPMDREPCPLDGRIFASEAIVERFPAEIRTPARNAERDHVWPFAAAVTALAAGRPGFATRRFRAPEQLAPDVAARRMLD
jgi:hypothetical protein